MRLGDYSATQILYVDSCFPTSMPSRAQDRHLLDRNHRPTGHSSIDANNRLSVSQSIAHDLIYFPQPDVSLIVR